MTEHDRRLGQRTTTGAEGMVRWRWTLDDVERLVASGVFSEFDRVELIGGELVPMSPKGNRHEHLRAELTNFLFEKLVGQVRIQQEAQFNLADDEFRNPDILVYPKSIRVHDVRGDTALIVIEIADTSYVYDSGAKAATYARFGVRDYWLINARTRVTEIYRDPTATGYPDPQRLAAEQPLVPLLLPELSVRLADLA